MHSLVQFAPARAFCVLQTLLKQAWLAATLAGDEQIRSMHLLTAMVETSGLTRCDGLWPLMTLTTSQLERLRPLLEAQSDERHDVALSEQAGNVSIIGGLHRYSMKHKIRLKAELRSLPFHRKSPFSIVLRLM
jgi:type VI secretion system protein VasG